MADEWERWVKNGSGEVSANVSSGVVELRHYTGDRQIADVQMVMTPKAAIKLARDLMRAAFTLDIKAGE